tara:strand:- start:14480 stop:14707 length:228 start_codon:yes stop_codon:yes gene_type:complete
MGTESRLLGVFQSVLGSDITAFKGDETPDTVKGWDSAAHLNLIMAIEAEFAVQFDIEEMESLDSVAAILKRLPEQ